MTFCDVLSCRSVLTATLRMLINCSPERERERAREMTFCHVILINCSPERERERERERDDVLWCASVV
jgi:hypothetical protein